MLYALTLFALSIKVALACIDDEYCESIYGRYSKCCVDNKQTINSTTFTIYACKDKLAASKLSCMNGVGNVCAWCQNDEQCCSQSRLHYH
ncbi:hypothetical protein FGO68_gene11623 [Halteria grandinella]|uniref:Uncharacterized protein n=1 Tax=Halteria grandinella TaxID=5974 RepID=A0A8J8NIE4_HALGN|nr:hypothetical protein FGO68_gene11623 [Halteria grandinella]